MVNPDLTFYGKIVYNEIYNLEPNKILYTIRADLYSDATYTTIIGEKMINGTQNILNNKTTFMENVLYTLPEGSISTYIAGQNVTDTSTAIFNKKNYFNAKIINGTGNFSFSNGYVILTLDGEIEDKKRKYEVYFDSSIIRAIQN
jgi:hypothetical protein